MVFNPTSPIEAFGRKPVIFNRISTPHSEVASIGRRSDMSENNSSRSSALSILPAWRGGMTNTNHRSQERHNPPQEISRWSKTTTESEASEAITLPQSPSPSPSPVKKMNVLKKKLRQRKLSKDTTSSSPVDPSYDPKTRTLALPGKTQPSIATSPVVGPIAGPDEPRSFYDSGSDDSSDAEPVLQRASSVRVGKPLIVQHSNSSGGSVPKLYPLETSPKGDESLIPKPLNLGHQLMNTHSPDDEEVSNVKVYSSGGPQDALKALEGHELGLESLSTVAEATSEASISPQDTVKRTVLEHPDTSAGDEGTDTLPTPMGGFGSLRINKTGSDTGYSTSTYIAPSLDGLRSNPITEFDKKLSRAISAPARHPARRVTIRPADLVINHANNDHKLFRESIVSTPYPARKNSVVEFEDQPAPEVVTPSRQLRRSRPLTNNNKDARPTEDKSKKGGVGGVDEDSKEKDLPPKIPLSTKPTISGGNGLVTARSDRFPSPVAPEVLFLDLRLARHPSARVTVEIEINDKTTFDDDQIFTIIRKTYDTKLLGFVRGILSARRLSHASLSKVSGSDDINIHRSSPITWHGHGQHPATGAIDGVDFAQHLLHPGLGHRRKVWLLWLRNQQYHGHSSRQARAARVVSQQSSPLDESESPVAFSFMHPRNNSHSFSLGHSHNNYVSPTMATIAPSTIINGGSSGGGSGGGLSRQVSTITGAHSRPSITIPRMPFQPFHVRDNSSPTSRKNSSSTTSTAPAPIHSHSHSRTHSNLTNGPPTLYLYYTFSIPRVLILFALTIIAAVFTTTMWILFGVPGRGAADGDGISMGEYGGDVQAYWRHDAHKRVGVGLLLGFVVLFLGLVAELAWVWGSWVLV
jgi:hypothetical protein